MTKPQFLRLERRIEFTCGHSENVRVTWFEDTPEAIEARWRQLAEEYECELCRQVDIQLDEWDCLNAEGLLHLEHVASLYDTVRTRSKP